MDDSLLLSIDIQKDTVTMFDQDESGNIVPVQYLTLDQFFEFINDCKKDEGQPLLLKEEFMQMLLANKQEGLN